MIIRWTDKQSFKTQTLMSLPHPHLHLISPPPSLPPTHLYPRLKDELKALQTGELAAIAAERDRSVAWVSGDGWRCTEYCIYEFVHG